MPQQLLLTYSFPPVASAESIVTAKMVAALAGQGWQSRVLTVAPRWNCFQEDPGLIQWLPPDAKVHRVMPWPLIKLPRLLRRLRMDYLALIADSLPDNSIYWYFGARRTLTKISRQADTSILHSRAMPMAGHFLGYKAKRATGLPWLLHFCDPWLDGPLYSSPHPRISRLHRRWERRLLSSADAVTFTTQASCDAVMSKHPSAWKEKCRVIPHGYTTHRVPADPRPLMDPAELNLVYLGNFYGTRHPDILFDAMGFLKSVGRLDDRLRVWLIGRMPHQQYLARIRSAGIEGSVRLRQSVPYETALAYGHQADVLLMFNSITSHPSFYLESKLIDYLGFRKPICGIVYPAGEAAALLQAAGGYVADIERAGHVAEVLCAVARDWRADRLKARGHFGHPRVEAYRMENTTRQLVDLMNGLIGRGQAAA